MVYYSVLSGLTVSDTFLNYPNRTPKRTNSGAEPILGEHLRSSSSQKSVPNPFSAGLEIFQNKPLAWKIKGTH